MYRLRQTETFADWLGRLRDAKAKARILARLESARLGNLGDTRALGGGVREMCGGDKSSQQQDIERARRMVAELDGG